MTATAGWRRFVGNRIDNVEEFAIVETDELAEIVFTLQPTGARFHVSWMQEDGADDDCLFYWLSLRDASHFNNGSLLPIEVNSSAFAFISDAVIQSVKLFGNFATDSVFACTLQSKNWEIAIATTCWLANKQRFCECGSANLAVLDIPTLQSWMRDQGVELIAEIN